MRKVLIVVIIVFILTSIISVAQAEMLSAEIKCEGCCNSDRQKFWVDEGKTITLIAHSSGGIGNKEYEWTVENGETVLGNSLKLTFTESVKYTLVVTDDIGYITKTVEIVQSSSAPSCLPSFRSVTIQDEYRRSEYAMGDVFEVRARLKDIRDCPDYNVYWETDDKNVAFTNPNSIKTDVIIGQGVKRGNVTITAVITNGEVKRKQSVIVKIVDNSPPQISVRYEQPSSYTNFNVYFDGSTTGKNRDENNDFIREYAVILFDENRNLVDSATRRGYVRRKVSCLSVKPNGWGIYFLEATITDSHGLTSSINETIEVKKGSTGKDIPVIFVSNDVIHCKTEEICKINAGETIRRDPEVSMFGYYINGGQIVNPNGDYCSGPVCKFIPTYPGTHKIKITAKYFGNDNIGSKVITVIVSDNKTSATPVPTKTRPISTPPAYCYQENQHTPAPETPGMEFGLAIAMLIIVIAMRRKNNKT
jgi:hypothetical protein